MVAIRKVLNPLFGDNTLFDTLDELPKPDLIIASPPCESWSNASAIPNGNACWKKEDLSDSLFKPQKEPSPFTIRNSRDYEQAYNNYKYDRQFMKRVNGELCVFNTIEIIKRYEPEFFIIENPASGRIWRYIEEVIGFESRRDGTMPPPTQLIKFEDYMDNQFLHECMQYYGDNYPDKMTIKMDLALDEFTFKYRKQGRRKERKLSSKMHLERAWALGA